MPFNVQIGAPERFLLAAENAHQVINHLGVSWVHAELRLVQLPDEDPGFMEKELECDNFGAR